MGGDLVVAVYVYNSASMPLVVCLLSFGLLALGASPTIDDILNLKRVQGVVISPDGRYITYGLSETVWEPDAYVRHIWIADASSGKTLQLTRGKKGVGAIAWSPDSQWIAFTSDREGGKNQAFAIRPDGGEAVQLTKSETAVNDFRWSSDGKTIAYTATDKRADDRKNQFDDYEVVLRDYVHTHIWTFDVAEAMKAPVTGKHITKGKDFSIGGFDWSPDNGRIAFSATVNPDLIQGVSSDIYVLTLADSSV